MSSDSGRQLNIAKVAGVFLTLNALVYDFFFGVWKSNLFDSR